MKKLKQILAAVVEHLGINNARLKRAQRKAVANAKKAQGNHQKALRADRAATKARQKADLAKDPDEIAKWQKRARKKEREAHRSHSRAHKFQDIAIKWKGRVKALTIKAHNLEISRAKVEARIAKLKTSHGVTIKGDTATGGSDRWRFVISCLTSSANAMSGKRSSFYSQSGTWTVDECLTGEEYGERSDCSQWLTSACRTAQLSDPNGTDWTGGYTGTQQQGNNGWYHAGEDAMKKAGFGFVIYGPGTGHHVEAYVGPGDKTIGHGSAPIDPGVINLFGDGDYRCYTLKQ